MNPSAAGWINKLLNELKESETFNSITPDALYKDLQNCGFIYGSNISITHNFIEKKDLSTDEICKINMVIALYVCNKSKSNSEDFIENTIAFYSEINAYKTTFLSDLLGQKPSTSLLEKILHKRIHIDNNLINKSFNYFITNALLFIDVLAFNSFLKTKQISETYIQQKENAIETIVLNTLNSKAQKSDYDKSLIDLFEQSLRYQKEEKINYSEALQVLKTPLDKKYIIDLACMATWNDKLLDAKEKMYLTQLGHDLDLGDKYVDASLSSIYKFYNTYKNDIDLLGSKNIVKTFYDNSSKMVFKLITRNSKRLHKELLQSKELMILLTKSTVKDLSDEEQKKVQEQLLDIFKTIPSLAIFLLPGGALLLPLVIKFIPRLLPSAFDDNRIEED